MIESGLWIIADPNGAGKTTLVQSGGLAPFISEAQSINPDQMTLALLQKRGFSTWADAPLEDQIKAFREAADASYARAEQMVRERRSLSIETVLSTDKYRPLVELALSVGFPVYVIYVALASPEVSAERVSARYRSGGHDVPKDKLPRRWQDSLNQLPWFLARAQMYWIYDNTTAPARLVATGTQGSKAVMEFEPFPQLQAALHTVSPF